MSTAAKRPASKATSSRLARSFWTASTGISHEHRENAACHHECGGPPENEVDGGHRVGFRGVECAYVCFRHPEVNRGQAATSSQIRV